MDATREELLALLELQKIDSAIDRLNSRQRNLPEQHGLDVLNERLRTGERAAGDKQAELDAVAVRMRKLEQEIDALERRVATEEKRLNSGDVNNPRELASLGAEVESLNRRKSKFEDEDLEVMEAQENLDKQMREMNQEIDKLRSEISAAAIKRDQANLEVAQELGKAKPRREHWTVRTPPELLKLYDDLRASRHGVGAARLEGSTCLGCHMQLPAQEVERLRKTPGVLRCEECGRILVVGA